MKKYSIPILVLALSAGLMTGCGCSNIPEETMMPLYTTSPTAVPAPRPTQAPTAPSYAEPTVPRATVPRTTVPQATLEDGNGPAPTVFRSVR